MRATEDGAGDAPDASYKSDAESSTVAEEVPRRRLTKKEKKAIYGTSANVAEPHATRREILKEVYRHGRFDGGCVEEQDEIFASVVYSIAENSDNPFEDIFTLFKVSHDQGINDKDTLTGSLLRNFHGWLNKQDCDFLEQLYERCVTHDLKVSVFLSVTASNITHLNLMAIIYRFDLLLNSEDRHFILDVVNRLLRNSEYKSAMDVASTYKLCDKFGLDEFIIPCLLKGQEAAVTAYLKDNQLKDLQIQFIHFLDEFVGLDVEDAACMLSRFKHVTKKLDLHNLTGSSVQKMIARRVREFGINPEEHAPRMNQKRWENQLIFNYTNRYKATCTVVLNDKAYFDMVKDILDKGNLQLKRFYIRFLYDKGERVDAIRWAMYYKMKTSSLSTSLQYDLGEEPELITEAQILLQIVTSAEAVSMILKDYNVPIEMIANAEGLRHMIDEISHHPLIGIDSEWKAQCTGVAESISLMQIATEERVYLVDFLALDKEKLSQADWEYFIRGLLCGESMKLGFDFIHDIRALFSIEETMSLQDIEEEMNNVVCIKRLSENLIEVDDTFVDIESVRAQQRARIEGDQDALSNPIHFKLSELSSSVCNVVLDKTQQVSNWNVRPLRNEQIQYAAMDAYIVVAIYQKLRDKAIANDMNFDMVLCKSHMNSKRKEREKAKRVRQKFEDLTWSQIYEEMNMNMSQSRVREATEGVEVKCVVDSMLLGLGKHLRRCGLDVVMAPQKPDMQKAMELSSRFAISSGKSYDELHKTFRVRAINVPVANRISSLEQVKHVLTKCKVKLNANDVFTRCMECNTVAFVRVPTPALAALYDAYMKTSCALLEGEQFDTRSWRNVLRRLVNEDPEKGYKFKLMSKRGSQLDAECDGGILHISRCMVQHERQLCAAVVQVHKVPEEMFDVRTRFFYVCGSCGRVFWDGPLYSTAALEVAEEA